MKEELKAKATSLLISGKSIKAVSERLGVTFDEVADLDKQLKDTNLVANSKKTKEELKAKATGLLLIGEKPIDVAKQVNLDYKDVNNIANKLGKEAKNEEVLSAMNNIETLKKIEQVVPDQYRSQVTEVITGLNGLDKLEEKLHNVLSKAISKADEYLDCELSIKEWQIVTKTISEAYRAVFSREQQTVVNVEQTQNVVGEEALNFFKAGRGM